MASSNQTLVVGADKNGRPTHFFVPSDLVFNIELVGGAEQNITVPLGNVTHALFSFTAGTTLQAGLDAPVPLVLPTPGPFIQLSNQIISPGPFGFIVKQQQIIRVLCRTNTDLSINFYRG